ncbi:DUF397 domain-containing protein [Streptomyces spirodelae]|uniref:DUF397 domain-containing protein n=1 Tax=Streptomyces spirodelae TaxID=2812904 RepID=A0ABS3WQU3_9ACTN|nr:DUF397 domain-containing protein [Streptomyces spirodelae]MBO8185487.1 DUF397 domain-containing protein [Streptomyces spirodelae]
MSSGTTELAWFKSSYSGSDGDSRVEVAMAEEAVNVRDSKDAAHRLLTVGRAGWSQVVHFAARR